MKLAFNGKGRFGEFDESYELYVKRAKGDPVVDATMYRRIVKKYCDRLVERLLEEGMVDLPNGLGSIAAAKITRKPQYRGNKFVGFGKMDWKQGHYDGKLKAFGMVYLPKRSKSENLRCYGYVANRALFKEMKKRYEYGVCNWKPIEFNDEMV